MELRRGGGRGVSAAPAAVPHREPRELRPVRGASAGRPALGPSAGAVAPRRGRAHLRHRLSQS